LLNEADLTAITDWVRQRSRLQRFLHGWGVASGLGVQRDPTDWTRVIVRPGYAIDACGEDIVVCGETPVSIKEICDRESESCGQLKAKPPSDGAQEEVLVGPLKMSVHELGYFDLMVSYAEEMSSPQPALARSLCRTAPPCDYSRVTETASFCWVPRSPGHKPGVEAASGWKKQFDATSAVVAEFKEFKGAGPSDSAVTAWLSNRLAQHPPTSFGFLPEMAADKRVDPGAVLFWMIQDARLELVRSQVVEPPEAGVPLARVIVRIRQAGGQPACTILRVDDSPPHRRPLSKGTLPAPAGTVNLAMALGQPPEKASAILQAAGLQVAPVAPGSEPFKPPADLDALEGFLAVSPFVPMGTRVNLGSIEHTGVVAVSGGQ